MTSKLDDTFVIKRNGEKEHLNYEKINKVLLWATEDINGVSASDIAMNADLKINNGITTKEIHQVLIKSAAELISEETPNYQAVASKLVNYLLRKEVFNTYNNFPRLKTLIKNNIDRGVYDAEIADLYTEKEMDKLEGFIKHNRDEHLAYAGIQQLIDKYLVRDRHTNEYHETPQFMYMLISMVIYSHIEDKQERRKLIKEHYDLLSSQTISLSTPVIAGIRTPNKQFSSCTLIDVDDDLESISASNSAVLRYISNKAGIGLNMRLRGEGASVNHGEKVHTGIIPFVKMFESSVKSCSQGGIRGGAATVHYPFWHFEIEEIISLKNNSGTELNSARRLDHSIQLSRLFYRRFINDEEITLFHPNETPGLMEAFGDNDKFDELYEKYERAYKPTTRKVKARDLMSQLAKERVETGRIYIQNIDNANTHSAFLDKINMSNLCQEINLPTTPIYDVNKEDGEIALCVLSAINLGKIKHFSDLELIVKQIVFTLDRIIDIQEYIVPAAAKMKKRRSIGIGVTNFAYWLAKNGYDYESDESLSAIDELFEHIQFYALKASMELAKEFGPCEYFDKTKYSEGLLPIDHYAAHVDTIVSREFTLDWEWLRGEIALYGLRNSTLTALMPCESSSVVSSSSNGMEPPRRLITVKTSKSGAPLPVVLPEINKLKNKYQMAFSFSNTSMNKVVSVAQKWIDQGISVNHYYDKRGYEKGLLPLSEVVNDILFFYKHGGKQLYYANSIDNSKKIDDNEGNEKQTLEELVQLSNEEDCEGGACAL